jgi:hypothetical protein
MPKTATKSKKKPAGPDIALNGGAVAAAPPAKKIGRPSTFTQEMADRICAELRTGRTLRSICLEEWAPSRDGVLGWADRIPAFADQYARALCDGLDVLAEETVDIAEAYIKPEDVPAARHRFDVRRWYLGNRAPKRWGTTRAEVDARAVVATVDVTPVVSDEQGCARFPR